MTTAASPISRHDLEAKLIKRCWENEAFRKEFLADPAACFAKYLSAPKAQLPKIVVHEEQPGRWHIVLPAKPAKIGELSDEELEKVAGGTDVGVTLIFSAMWVSAAASAGSAFLTLKEEGW